MASTGSRCSDSARCSNNAALRTAGRNGAPCAAIISDAAVACNAVLAASVLGSPRFGGRADHSAVTAGACFSARATATATVEVSRAVTMATARADPTALRTQIVSFSAARVVPGIYINIRLCAGGIRVQREQLRVLYMLWLLGNGTGSTML